MKALIVYVSIHHQNTEIVARVMAEELGADLIPVNQARHGLIEAYDLVGFGSGIFYMRFHKTLRQYVETLPAVLGKQAFVFSTSGEGTNARHDPLKKQLMDRGFSIIGEFSCKGWDSWGPLKLIGGTNKWRPNEADLAEARAFARGLKKQS